MEELFQNKYRNCSVRLQSWNYGWDGIYSVTICTGNREEYFGKIQQNKMCLNEIGTIAYKYWQEIPQYFPHMILDAFVIMPNHLHGIVMIDKNNAYRICRDAINRVPTNDYGFSNDYVFPNTTRGGVTHHHNPMLYKNLSTMIRWYKGRTTFEIHKTNNDFLWQPRFYDRIIWDENALDIVREYIINNPAKWSRDRNNQKNR